MNDDIILSAFIRSIHGFIIACVLYNSYIIYTKGEKRGLLLLLPASLMKLFLFPPIKKPPFSPAEKRENRAHILRH